MKGVISLPNGCEYEHDIFISYPHMPEEHLIIEFVEELAKTLKFLRVATDLPEPVYLDRERFSLAFTWHQALSTALCHSRCMLAVYIDIYFSREYCMREWAGMIELEKKRIGKRIDAMIIPILLRAREDKGGKPILPAPNATPAICGLPGLS